MEKSDQTKVFNLGSLHGLMLDHPKYELSIFMEAIIQFQPDVIFTEVRTTHPGFVDGSIDGGLEQSIIYAVSKLWTAGAKLDSIFASI